MDIIFLSLGCGVTGVRSEETEQWQIWRRSSGRYFCPSVSACIGIATCHIELLVSLFIRCTMRCEIWAQPAELPR